MQSLKPKEQNATVLVIGSGGREHVLAWALARSPEVGQVYVAPGNAGTEWAAAPDIPIAPCANLPIPVGDIPALVAFACDKQVNLTVVGPEAVLAAGIVDAFQAAHQPIFGSTRAATRLESSKAFAKAFMRENGIPTADYAVFDDYGAAHRFLEEKGRTAQQPVPLVVKADGLAAGKGVIVCANLDEARAALHRVMVEREFGTAGDVVVLEERLQGREVSLLAFSDGQTVVPMPPARDHKRVFDGDQGPNTGGMGAYTPVPDVPPALVEELTRTVLQPAITGMATRGMPYVGVLYAGLMLTPDGPSVLEFNCRFGDPEAQAILPLLSTRHNEGDASFFAILRACVEGRLADVAVRWQPGACATVVLVSGGYPGAYPTGLPIRGLDKVDIMKDVVVFQAGTARKDGQIVTAGGRVLAVSAIGDNLPGALQHIYVAIEHIHFDGMHYRRDIGGGK